MSVVAVLHLLLSPYLFHEGENPAEVDEAEAHPVQRMRAAIRFAATTFDLRDILILGAVLGIGMGMVEGYWQPRLSEIDPAMAYARFGWVTAGYFAMAIGGPLAIGAFATKTGVSARAASGAPSCARGRIGSPVISIRVLGFRGRLSGAHAGHRHDRIGAGDRDEQGDT